MIVVLTGGIRGSYQFWATVGLIAGLTGVVGGMLSLWLETFDAWVGMGLIVLGAVATAVFGVFLYSFYRINRWIGE